MRRIKIDAGLDAQVHNFYVKLFNGRAIFKNVDYDLSMLAEKYSKLGKHSFVKYIRVLNEYLFDIATAKPNEIPAWIDIFEKIVASSSIPEDFYKELVNKLRYKDLREKEILKLYQDLGIKACIYCNAQLCAVMDVAYYKIGAEKGTVKDRKAIFELDHHHPKSKYPFLSISFFNLLPCCASCNKSKSANPALFYLYAQDDNLEVFSFEIDKASVIRFWKKRDLDELVIRFVSSNSRILDNHNELFDTQKLYDIQKDIVEELIHKRIAYSKIYKKYLVNGYGRKLFSDQAMIDRLIIGNYDKPEDVHKRPLAKFTQDIARQLELIK